jgi:hypothetical protein
MTSETTTIPGVTITMQTTTAPAMRVPIPCSCGCKVPAGYIVVECGRLVIQIESRHHGEKHVTRFDIGSIRKLLIDS